MKETLTIAGRFCGPPNMSNGGYISGQVAEQLNGTVTAAAEVTLRRPTPLDIPLALECHHGSVVLKDGPVALVEARPAELELAIPTPPSYAEAKTASENYFGFIMHPFPNCFVFGPQRAPVDGLRIFPNPVPGYDLVAAAWTPDASLTDETGLVRPSFLWAALDCPGGIAAIIDRPRPILLGRLTATISQRPHGGEPCIVIGWKIGQEDRKFLVGTALFSADGTLYACAEAVWIEPKS
jgi:hypothetical protein